MGRFIGAGNGASVYLASDGDKEVAVKIRERQEGKHERFLFTRFRESARLQALFCHPNIVWLHEAIEGERFQSLILEYLAGGPLSDYLEANGGHLSRSDVCELGFYIADALDHMHDMGVTHRDLKPDNLIFGNSTDLSSIKVADFDVSKQPLWSPDITQNGSHVGTLWYISPEQFDQAKPKPTADVYSLGIVLYESLTGRLPFEPLNSASAVYQRFLDNAPLFPLSLANPEADPAIEWVIERAADSVLSTRIPSAATLATFMMALEPRLSESPRAALMLRRTDKRWIQHHLNEAPESARASLYPALARLEVVD